MANEPVSTPIHNEYTTHLAAALAANQAEQAILTERLNKLQGDEKWLAAALADTPQHVGAEPVLSPEPVQPAHSTPPVADGPEAAAVPLPRTGKTTGGAAPAKKAAASSKGTAKPAATPAKKTAAKKAAAKKTAAAAAGKPETTEPTLGQLLGALLSKQPGEPKKVSEIQSELEAAHPERATSVQTIRNALQQLVKKEKLERDSRQGTVFYTSPVPEANPAPSNESKAEEPAPASV